MRTVLQIIPAFGTGGAEQACLDMGVALVARGDRALIVSEGGWRVPLAQDAGVLHISKNVATKNPARIIKNALWLADLMRREHVDIVHARSRAPAWSAFLACRRTGCPFVTTVHAAYKFSCALKRAYNRVMVLGARVIAISPFIVDYITASYGIPQERIRLVNRGIDTEKFDLLKIQEQRKVDLRQAWGIEANTRPVILFPARLSPIKGHEILIEALAQLKREGQTLPLTLIVGDDQGRQAYSQRLRDLIAVEELGADVKLVGACSDMPAAYALATLAVQPSLQPEGFGRVPVEAMAMGVPVMASDLGAMKDTVLDGKTGWLVPPADVQAWAQALTKALGLSEEERRGMIHHARAHVLAHYTNTAMVRQTLAVYEELVPHA